MPRRKIFPSESKPVKTLEDSPQTIAAVRRPWVGEEEKRNSFAIPTFGNGAAFWNRLLRVGIVFVAFGVGLVFARDYLATTFHPYDDEGYMLLSLKHYLAGEHLYTEVASQYGPFYLFAQATLFRLLSLPVNHDAGRTVTVICWLLSATLAGYFVYRISRNTILASAAGLASVLLDRVLASEPGHPQQIILPILMLACCVSIYNGPASFVLIGALGVALIFTKINVGAFFLAAVGLTLLCRFSAGPVRTVGAVCMLVYMGSIPTLLMKKDIHTWALGYCLLATLSGISTCLAGLITTPSSPKPWRSVLFTGSGVVIATTLIVLTTRLQGMSPSTLLDGVVWGPLKHPGLFEIPLNVSIKSVLCGLLVLACLGSVYWLRHNQSKSADWIDAIRATIGLCIILRLISHRVESIPLLSLPFLGTLLPLGLLPTNKGTWQFSDYFPRLFVTSVAVTQLLQPYPVAVSQLNIAEAPLLLWAFFCLHDGLDGLGRLVSRTMKWTLMSFPGESFFAVVVIICTMIPLLGYGRSHPHYTASSLRGLSSLRLPESEMNLYEVLSEDISANCDVLFTLPGMGSFNLWSGVPAPNGLNMTAWMKGFNLAQQDKVLKVVKMEPRACVVYNTKMVEFWQTSKDDLDRLPLARYILYDMIKVAEIGDYEIRISPHRNSRWIAADAHPFIDTAK